MAKHASFAVGDRLRVGQWILISPIQVQILVSQPAGNNNRNRSTGVSNDDSPRQTCAYILAPISLSIASVFVSPIVLLTSSAV